MKALVYGWELPPYISGGLGVACHGIIQGLLDNDCEVTVILPDKISADKNIFKNADKLTLINANFFQDNLNAYFTLHKKKLISSIKEYAEFAGKFAKEIAHDVIHVHDWLTVLAGLEAKQISHKPLFFHIHSLEVERSANANNKAIYDIEKKGLLLCDRILTVSGFTKNNVIKEYGISSAKISVVHNGLFKEQIQISSGQSFEEHKNKTALFLGRLTSQKSPLQFIDAAAKILKKRKDIQFIVAGDGDLFKKCVEKVAKLKLGSYIHFTKFLNREEVSEIYKKSQVYVMPSIAEPFGLTCLEAICHHVPVICSSQSGVSEVIQNIIKVDYWDTDEIAESIIALIDSPELRKKMIKNSLSELDQLLWSEVGKKIMGIYQQFS